MMFGEMQAVEAGLVAFLDEGKPLIKKLRGRAFAVLDVIEQSNFHFSSSPSDLMTGMRAALPAGSTVPARRRAGNRAADENARDARRRISRLRLRLYF
jgi:hypothetical protein